MSAQISEQDLQVITEALLLGWDKVGAELSIVLRAAGYPVEDNELNEIAKEIGIDDKEYLTVEKVCLAASKLPKEQQASNAMQVAFVNFDKHQDQTITVEDLKLVLESMANLTNDEVEAITEELDPEDIGRVHLNNLYSSFVSKNFCV